LSPHEELKPLALVHRFGAEKNQKLIRKREKKEKKKERKEKRHVDDPNDKSKM
jgi:hypothetical protein